MQLSANIENYEQDNNNRLQLLNNSSIKNLADKYNSIISKEKDENLLINGKKYRENRVRSAKSPKPRRRDTIETEEEEDLNIWNYTPYDLSIINRVKKKTKTKK